MFSFSFLNEKIGLISINFGKMNVYFWNHLPIAFRNAAKKEVVFREPGGVSLEAINELKYIFDFSGKYKFVEKDHQGFQAALKEFYKKVIYSECSRLTLNRMGVKNDSPESNTDKLRNISIRPIDEGS